MSDFKPMSITDMFRRQEITDAEATELDQLRPVFLNTGERHHPEYVGLTEEQIARQRQEHYLSRGYTERAAAQVAAADARVLMALDRRLPPKRWWQRIGVIFAWYDLWVGCYWDRQARRLYILPLPTLGLVFDFGD